jgi:hypothetical protein
MDNFPSFYSQDLKNVVKKLLVIAPEERPSFNEIGEYIIFDEMDQFKVNFAKLMID